MGKFLIECPKCGKFLEGSSSVFGKKVLKCSCGHEISTKNEALKSTKCKNCGNSVVFDAKKGEEAKCPVCDAKINTKEDNATYKRISCPQCNCLLDVDKNSDFDTCPVCDFTIDIKKTIKKDELNDKELLSVIKYEGPNDVFVWKHPVENFKIGSQLIVHESQEAIFFRDGQALDLFGAGRHALETQNLPLMDKLYKLPVEQSMFHSEVYYINQTVQMGIKWGTDSKVRMFDPGTGLYVELGASGQFNIKVCNSRKLLIKLVGTSSSLEQGELLGTVGQTGKEMVGKFRALVMNKVKSCLATSIKESKINILEIDAQLDTLSEALRQEINVTLEDYGLTMPEFYITTIMTPDDDPNFRRLKQQYAEKFLKVHEEQIRQAEAEAAQKRKMVEAQTEAQMKIIEAQGEATAYKLQAEAEAEEMKMKGYTYQQETARKVGVGAVENGFGGGGSAEGGTGIGGIANLGIGLGVMGGVLNMTKDAMTPLTESSQALGQKINEGMNADKWTCGCGTVNTGKFCSNCGSGKVVANSWTCECGAVNTGKFCSNCGAKQALTWDCSCGKKGNTGKFCSECGAKQETSWDCACGQKEIKGKFCPNCGNKRSE